MINIAIGICRLKSFLTIFQLFRSLYKIKGINIFRMLRYSTRCYKEYAIKIKLHRGQPAYSWSHSYTFHSSPVSQLTEQSSAVFLWKDPLAMCLKYRGVISCGLQMTIKQGNM